MSKIDIQQVVTDKIIEQIETLGSNWVMPFATRGNTMPINAKTRAAYRGINILMLGFAPYGSNEWATYKQWESKGAQVKKGEKGTMIVFWKILDKKAKKGDKGKPGSFAFLKYSNVFNAEQVEGYEPAAPEAAPQDMTEVLASVDTYIANLGANWSEGTTGAWYMPSQDRIEMPPRCDFHATDAGSATEHYYSTMLHEHGHWTGHTSRLNRLGEKSKRGYAFEELVAELTACFQCVHLGIDHEVREDHAQYLAGWLKALKGDKKYIFEAAKLAQKAVEFMDSKQPEMIEFEAA